MLLWEIKSWQNHPSLPITSKPRVGLLLIYWFLMSWALLIHSKSFLARFIRNTAPHSQLYQYTMQRKALEIRIDWVLIRFLKWGHLTLSIIICLCHIKGVKWKRESTKHAFLSLRFKTIQSETSSVNFSQVSENLQPPVESWYGTITDIQGFKEPQGTYSFGGYMVVWDGGGRRFFWMRLTLSLFDSHFRVLLWSQKQLFEYLTPT